MSSFEEAQQSIERISETSLMGHDLLQVCLDPQQAAQLDRIARTTETAVLSGVDGEPRYVFGTLLSYCGKEDAAVRLLRSAIEHNYCAYQTLQSDPMLVKLRGTPEFSELLSAAKECRNKFLGERNQSLH